MSRFKRNHPEPQHSASALGVPAATADRQEGGAGQGSENAHTGTKAAEADKKPADWSLNYDRALATVTSLSLVIGGCWSAFLFLQQRDSDLKHRRSEYLLQLRKEKRELYQPLCTTVAKISTARTMGEAKPHIEKFWELYFGDIHLIKDDDVQKAKEDFSDALLALQNQTDEQPDGELRNLAHAVVMACQKATELEPAYEISPSR